MDGPEFLHLSVIVDGHVMHTLDAVHGHDRPFQIMQELPVAPSSDQRVCRLHKRLCRRPQDKEADDHGDPEFQIQMKAQENISRYQRSEGEQDVQDSVLSEEFMPRRDTAPSFDGELHLLLAEDNDINREIARIQAERSGFIVDTAENGKEALDIFATSPVGYYRIILMDIMMPVMDGLTAAREIRALDRKDAKSVYIVAMTANAYAEDIDRSIESGMDSHLSKPFREADLKKLFRDVASSRGLA